MNRARLQSLMLIALAGAAALALACDDPIEGRRSFDFGDPEQSLPPADTEEDPEDVPSDPSCPAVGGIPYQRPNPNVMLLVDRSGSMAEPGACNDATCPSKWQQLLALSSYLEEIKAHARLGLSVFPSQGSASCGVSAGLEVPLTDAANVDQMILGAVAGMGPDGRTPIPEALDEVAANGGLDDPSRDNVIVLLTDGMPNCACESDAACEQQRAVEAVERLVNRPVPIRLDVVGFSASADVASETLSAMAVAAGTALPGPVSYFQADTIEELIGRLYQVAAGLAPCRFNLDESPESGSLKVWLDDALVAPCASQPCSSGYTYDEPAGEVELHGSSCQAIRDGQCHSVWFDTEASE